jgi:hypothetical protein
MMIHLIIFLIIQFSLAFDSKSNPQNETLIALEYQALHYFDYPKNSTTKVSSYLKSS